MPCWFSKLNNSLWSNDAIWHHRTWSVLVQVMACCLLATSHYLNQYWLIISDIRWHSSEDIIIGKCEDTNQQSKIRKGSFEITSRSSRYQWVKNNSMATWPYWIIISSLFQYKDTILSGVHLIMERRPRCNQFCSTISGSWWPNRNVLLYKRS